MKMKIKTETKIKIKTVAWLEALALIPASARVQSVCHSRLIKSPHIEITRFYLMTGSSNEGCRQGADWQVWIPNDCPP